MKSSFTLLLTLASYVALCCGQRVDQVLLLMDQIGASNRNILQELIVILQPDNVPNVVNCLIDFSAKDDCDPRARLVRRVIPLLHRSGMQCPQCQPETQAAVDKFVEAIRSNPEDCDRLANSLQLTELC
ncbi:uncharacterized protein [Macrobrachium rosenbergii]|uniref:uncharacterized protein n=1 Tax=Macrobrachium rosenbergii TaxID=79674 RepID=UPI0034D4418F